MFTVVPEKSEHFEAVRRQTIAAFSASEHGHHGEADLIDALREQSSDLISLVALQRDKVVGHIMFSPASILSGSSTLRGWGLAPLSVEPACQDRGIGSLLVREGLRIIAATDADFTVVAGHSGFYSRFGFLPAQQFDVSHGFVGMPQDNFHIHFNHDHLHSKISEGLAFYHPVFGVQHPGHNRTDESR